AVLARYVGTCIDEAALIHSEEAVEPISVRRGANKNKHCGGANRLRFASRAIAQRQTFEVLFSERLGYFGVSKHFDIRGRFNLIDKIARHALGKRTGSKNHSHLAGILREMHRALARG